MNKNVNRLETLASLGLITLVTALTYGILIPQLGFYRDDWYMLWAGQALGSQGIVSLFRTDRPFIGWVYALDFSMLDVNPLGWHIYALVLKILGGLACFWLLRRLWPHKRLETTTAALLFTLYPGFLQQGNAATFKNLLLSYDLIILSLALSIYALQTPRRVYGAAATLLGMLAQLVALLIYESLIGLEAARLLLLWYVIHQREPARFRDEALKTLKAYLPSLLIAGGFLFWRVFLFQSERRATSLEVIFSHYGASPLYSLAGLAIEWGKDFVETLVFAWVVPFYQFTDESRHGNFVNALLLGIVAAGLTGVYFRVARRMSPPETDKPASGSPSHLIWLGLPIILLTSLPIVAAGRNVLFATQWDRYTYQGILGVALAVAGFAFYVLRGRLRWGFLLALVFFSVVTQYFAANYYRNLWNYERNIWWQLAWRAPALQPETTLVVSLPEGFRLAEEYEIWGPANMIYAPGQPMLVSGQVPTDVLILDLAAGTKEKRDMRNLIVKRDYSQALILSLPSSNSCVHILDGQNSILPFFEDGRLRQIAPYSNIDLIDLAATPVTPSATTFGAEPEHGWCFYYQKIQLAMQLGDWNQAASFADETVQKGLEPSDESEWLPVIAAYTSLGRGDDAQKIARSISNTSRDYFCLQLKEATWPAGYNAEAIQAAVCR